MPGEELAWSPLVCEMRLAARKAAPKGRIDANRWREFWRLLRGAYDAGQGVPR